MITADLRTVPRFVTAHTFCASRNELRNSGFLRMVPTNTEIFCAVYDYAGKAGLSKGCCNPERKLGVTKHFSEIIELKFEKKMPYIVLCFKTFLKIWLLNYL